MSKDLLFILRSIRVLGTSNSAFSLVKRPVFFFALEAVALEAAVLDGVALEGGASDDVASDDVVLEGVAILSNAPFSTKLLFFSGANASDDSVPCGSSFVLCKLNSYYTHRPYTLRT